MITVRKALLILVPVALGLLAYNAMLDAISQSTPPPVQKTNEDSSLKPRVPENQIYLTRALKNPVPVNENSLALGKALYFGKGTCKGCHGDGGMGDGELSPSFDPKPRNFHDAMWQTARTDGEIFWAITNGTELGMVPFGKLLSEQERWSLVAYVRLLGK